MRNKDSRAASAPPSFMEPLEGRTMLSATYATSTSFAASSQSPAFGVPLTLSVVVRGQGAVVGHPTGIVEFLVQEGKKDVTFTTAKVSHTGHASFTFSPGNALFVGKYSFSARYLGDASFNGSKARPDGVSVPSPTLATASNGLETATTLPGTGTGVKTGDTITVDYTGFLESNGQIFDDSLNHSPGTFQFQLGGNVIAGWNQGIVGMKLGETRVLVIPAALAYGNNPPAGSIITAGANLVFVIHLVSIP